MPDITQIQVDETVYDIRDNTARYEARNHNHDSNYAAINHNHDSSYAAINHNHDSDYAAIDHNHDSDYAAINHNHDNRITNLIYDYSTFVIYAPISAGSTATFYDSRISADAWKVVDLIFDDPAYVLTDVAWSTNKNNHSVTLTGTIKSATNVAIKFEFINPVYGDGTIS